MTTNLFHLENVQKEVPLELYDSPEVINIKTFYKILETNNLLLLAKNQEQVRPEDQYRLVSVWHNLLDFYYSSTNRQSWENFLRNYSNAINIQKEILGCKAAFEMCQLTDERGFEHLKSFGINSTDLGVINSAILMKETKLRLAENKLQSNNEKESFNFYDTLASVEYQLKRSVDIEKTSLAQWVAIVKDLSKRNKAELEAYNKQKKR